MHTRRTQIASAGHSEQPADQYLHRETLPWAEESYFGCLAFRFPSSFCWRCARVTDFWGISWNHFTHNSPPAKP
jgi:hypothetical protein